MGYFNSWRFHKHLGFVYGLGLLAAQFSKDEIKKKIQELDIQGYEREWKQNLKANNPNEIMSAHQIEEAEAWGKGARKSTGLQDLPLPPELPALLAQWRAAAFQS